MKTQRSPLYLFACHLEWQQARNLEAYKDLVAALDHPDEDIRQVAESLLHRSSPRPQLRKQPSPMRLSMAMPGQRF